MKGYKGSKVANEVVITISMDIVKIP